MRPAELNHTLVERFDDWLLVQHYSVMTKGRYMATARRFVRHLHGRRLTTTTHSDVQQYLGSCARKNPSVHVLNIELLGLRCLFDFLSLGGLMNWVPPRLVRLRYAGPRFPRFLSREDVRKLFRQVRTLRERVVLEILYGTGCRSCELSRMRIEDIDYQERRIKVRTKQRPYRFLMITPRLAKLLRRYIGPRTKGYVLADGRPLQSLPVYRRKTGKWLTRYRTYDEKGRNLGFFTRYLPPGSCEDNANSARAEFLKRCKNDGRILRPLGLVPISIFGILMTVQRVGVRAGLRVYPRMLRHSLATHLMDNGADLRVVSACLGHTQTKSTMVYLHVSQKRAQAAFERFHPMQ